MHTWIFYYYSSNNVLISFVSKHAAVRRASGLAAEMARGINTEKSEAILLYTEVHSFAWKEDSSG